MEPQDQNLQQNEGEDYSQQPSEDTSAQESQIKERPISEKEAKKTKILKIVLAVLVGVLILGGGAFAYMNFFQELKPEEVMAKMKENQAQVTSHAYQGSVDLNFDLEGQAMADMFPSELSLVFTGKSEKQEENKANTQSDINIESDFMMLPKAEFSLISSEDDNYIKFNSLPEIMFLDLSAFEEKWITIDAQEIAQTTGKTDANTEATKDKLKNVMDSIKNYDYIKIDEELEEEEINGNATYHYSFHLDKEGIKTIYTTLNEDMDEEAEKSLQEVLDKLQGGGEIWIDKDKFLISKLAYDSGVAKIEDDEDFNSAQVILDLNFSEYNQDFEIKKPEDSQSFEELFADLQENGAGAALGIGGFHDEGSTKLDMDLGEVSTSTSETDLSPEDFPESGEDISIEDLKKESESNNPEDTAEENPEENSELDSDNDGLSDLEEEEYGTDPNNPDSDGDGYLDGEEVENGYDPLS